MAGEIRDRDVECSVSVDVAKRDIVGTTAYLIAHAWHQISISCREEDRDSRQTFVGRDDVGYSIPVHVSHAARPDVSRVWRSPKWRAGCR